MGLFLWPLQIIPNAAHSKPMSVYAIGDIHGHIDKLEPVLDLIEADRASYGIPNAPVVQVGDLVDRGPESCAVIERLCDLRDTDPRLTVLLGNHDALFLGFLTSGAERDGRLRAGLTWLSPNMGGQTTLASYGINTKQLMPEILAEARARVPAHHRDFLRSLKLSAQVDDALFVHAGIRPGIPINMQDPEDLYWIRQEFLTDASDHGALVVHGHTPVKRVEHHGNRLAIDTGAAFGGPLSAVVIEERRVFLLTANGRQEVTPHASA